LTAEYVLTTLSEEADLAVILWRRVSWPLGTRIQSLVGAPDDHGLVEHQLLGSGKPDVTRDGLFREYKPTGGRSVQNVDNRGIAPIMRCKIDTRERNAVAATVVVDGQIGKTFVGADKGTASDEVCREHTVAALPRQIVNPVFGQKQPPPKQSYSPPCLDDRCTHYGPVLVAINSKEVTPELGRHCLGQT